MGFPLWPIGLLIAGLLGAFDQTKIAWIAVAITALLALIR